MLQLPPVSLQTCPSAGAQSPVIDQSCGLFRMFGPGFLHGNLHPVPVLQGIWMIDPAVK